MKVIAKIDENRVLCEVSTNEIALLNGFRSKFETGCDINKLTAINAECNLAKMANTSVFVRTMNENVLKSAKVKLEEAINGIDVAMEEVSKLTIFETLKDSG